ncbi:MAG: NAD(P)-dependent oxidoreductase [Micrococcaceae bacterium]|nr:NAD(P)-dependent oxidoreductase [Micrococcaceae bacterium]
MDQTGSHEPGAVAKKTVFLTGATGSMGSATLLELAGRLDRFNIVILAQRSLRSRAALRRYAKMPGIRIVWGDLRDYSSVLECVNGADYVLHAAAIISPAADRDPVATEQVNVGSISNILAAIREQPDPDAVRLVTVGSVAMTGSRLPPQHWGRVGDPIAPALGDHYAVSKIEAERLVVESGLAHWVSLRQTFICIPRLLSLLHPILFHQPVNTAFEFVTARDSGLMMANACESWVDEGFWRRVYNIGGGDDCRVGYIEYLDRVFNSFGLGATAELFERSWFALRNFHCQWYLDSDVLEGHLHFQRDGFNDYLAQVAAEAPWYLKAGLARIVPSRLVRVLLMKRIARRPEGPFHWIETGDGELIEAFFGSRAEWESIPGWDREIPAPGPPQPLSHGFNDELPDVEIGLVHARSAAGFRGGECRAKTLETGDLYTPVPWRCAFGHDFTATGYLVLRAGHWCPDCEAPPWNFDRIAAANPFFAQVWPVKKTPDQHAETPG